jgi:hypothetical protein
MPRSQEFVGPLNHDPLHASKLSHAEPAAVGQPHRFESKLRLVGLPFDMDMRRLMPVARVKEEPVRPFTMNSWHQTIVATGRARRPQDLLAAGSYNRTDTGDIVC